MATVQKSKTQRLSGRKRNKSCMSDTRMRQHRDTEPKSPDVRQSTFGVGRTAFDKVVSPLKSNF